MITSLHSPHVEGVKALLGSRGVKERRERGLFVVEGASSFREALGSNTSRIETLYLTDDGRSRISDLDLSALNVIEVSPQVMAAMSDTVSPQGILALVKIDKGSFEEWFARENSSAKKIAYFWQLQDPGNAGTVIRAADAFGLDAVLFSDNSVDIYGPKVVRSSVGSHWHLPIFCEISWESIRGFAKSNGISLYALDADGRKELLASAQDSAGGSSIWIFGNEARGLPDDITRDTSVTTVAIPMSGRAESLNLASAASVVMYAVGQSVK